MCQLPCTLRKVVLAITVMGMVKLLAEIVGEWAVLVLECFMHNVYGVVVREKSNADSVAVPATENDALMKRNNTNINMINDLRRMIIVSGIGKMMIKNIGHYITIVCIYIMLTVSVAVSAQTRRALVIGIGQQEDKAWGKINGDKDVPYVEEMLKNARFKTGNVKKLVNQQATKAAIVNALKSLASQSKHGDIVYVHFSGHGQQMKDVHNDEKDGLDECWIPYDAYRKPCNKDRGEKHLTDDEVNYYLNAIRDKIGDTGKMLVLIDACHSGGATRGDEDEVVRGVEDIFEAIKSFIWGPSTGKGKTVVNPNAQENKERWITISACKSDQANIEMKSPAVGKLTYAIYNKVKESTGNDNYDFIRRIRKFVNSNTGSRPQYPEMTGETDRYRITDIIQ